MIILRNEILTIFDNNFMFVLKMWRLYQNPKHHITFIHNDTNRQMDSEIDS